MSKASRKMDRARAATARKAAKRDYQNNRELGPCFADECQNNGDSITHCRLCDFKVQACPEHSMAGRNKAKKHLLAEHPAKTVPTLVLGVLRGQSLD
jgi:hypothetical protein